MNLNEAHNKALEVIETYGIRDVTIKWDNARGRAGICNYFRDGRRVVIFSRLAFAMLPEHEQLDTITHELAHARLHHSKGHGPEWKAIHRSMGGSGTVAIADTTVAIAIVKWHGICRVDGGQVRAFRNRLTDKTRRELGCACHKATLRWVPNNV